MSKSSTSEIVSHEKFCLIDSCFNISCNFLNNRNTWKKNRNIIYKNNYCYFRFWTFVVIQIKIILKTWSIHRIFLLAFSKCSTNFKYYSDVIWIVNSYLEIEFFLSCYENKNEITYFYQRHKFTCMLKFM